MNASPPPALCPSCGQPVPSALGFCPACLLRAALAGEEADPRDSPSEDTLFVPSDGPSEMRFDQYQLLPGPNGQPLELGRGAMGVTYQAIDLALRRTVALKVIAERCLGDRGARLRFVREARAAARVCHPNVASVFHLGQRAGQYFYAMEWVAGETLAARLKREGRLEVNVALDIAGQVAAGLGALHQQGLVHRDVKPSNVMLSRGEGGAVSAKLIDLGLAKAVQAAGLQTTTLSLPGAFVGTPAYASPEQFAVLPVDIRSDLYSLGVTLWQMLSGQPPFRGSPAELMHQHLHAPLALERLGAVPPSAVALLEALLEKDPARRFQDPAELLGALAAVRAAIEAGRAMDRVRLERVGTNSLTHAIEVRCAVDRARGPSVVISDIIIANQDPHLRKAVLDFRVTNKGESLVSISRVRFKVLKARDLDLRVRSLGRLEFSAKYDLDISHLARMGQIAEVAVAHQLQPGETDRFSVTLTAHHLSTGVVRVWSLEPTLVTSEGEVKGMNVEVCLAEEIPDVQRRLPVDSYAVTRPLPTRSGPEKISVARLPVTGGHLFGREADLAFLNGAWADPQVKVVSIVAWAGVGKSTLVNHWLRLLAAQGYRSAELVFGWSFYQQGIRKDAPSSADEFMDAALAWFGDPDPRLGSAWEKGERLARLIGQRRALVILDGLEPLQHPPGPQEGRLREPCLQAFVRELAASNQGLCVITTRLALADLADQEGGPALRRELDHLSPEAGAQLLRALGVKGPETELRCASQEFRGHGLALTLLGNYLADAYQGDIRCREAVFSPFADDGREGVHARNAMGSYEGWFGEGPELSALRLLGLFDRPADEKAVGALLKPPAIAGLTESLTDLSPARWRRLLARLRRAGLLAEDPNQPGQLDAHPLVREYFGDQLRTQLTGAWQEGNGRLYEHYRALAPGLPESVRAMEPLFLAVACGCRAGRFRDALHEVYLPRIQRGDAAFAAKALGAKAALLSVLVHFFDQGRWGSLADTAIEGQRLTAEDQLFVLMEAGKYLTFTRGFAAPEARRCYGRAEPLAEALNCPALLYAALMGRYNHSLVTDRLTATMQIAQRVHSVAQEQNDAALLVGACRALAATLYFRGDFEAARRYAMRGMELWRSGGGLPTLEEATAPAVICLCHQALTEWHLIGMAASNTEFLSNRDSMTEWHLISMAAGSHAALMVKAIALAKALNDAHALAMALYFAATLEGLEGAWSEVERLASDLMVLSTGDHSPFWLAAGELLRGWARSACGDATQALEWIERGIANLRAMGWWLGLPQSLAAKAEALHLAGRTAEALTVLQEAEAVAERSEERCWRAELYRLRGVFLAALGAKGAEVEAAFGEALRTAEEQKSISLMKRAEANLADYRREGKCSVHSFTSFPGSWVGSVGTCRPEG